MDKIFNKAERAEIKEIIKEYLEEQFKPPVIKSEVTPEQVEAFRKILEESMKSSEIGVDLYQSVSFGGKLK
jgi:hypothetical protein